VGLQRPSRGQTKQVFRPQTVTSAKSMTSPAAQDLVVGLRRPSWGQTCGSMLGVIARIAPERPATRPATKKSADCSILDSAVPEGRLAVISHQSCRSQNFSFSLEANSAELPLGGDFYSKLRAPHRGTSLGPFVCRANEISAARQRRLVQAVVYMNAHRGPDRGNPGRCHAPRTIKAVCTYNPPPASSMG
jgi:hypothetical protein